MAEEDKNRSEERPLWSREDANLTGVEHDAADIKLPEVPGVPQLPDVPVLKPNLPKLEKPSQAAEEYRNQGIAYTLPMMLVAPILLLTFTGYWLDNHFHKSPAFTIGGALLGAVSGLINMIRAANK